MGALLTISEKCEEVRRLRQEGKTLAEALKIVEGYEGSDQTVPSNHNQKIKDSITQ